MDINQFPRSIGRLVRKSGLKHDEEFTSVIYGLDQELHASKKFAQMRNVQFKVVAGSENGYRILINNDLFTEAFSVADVPAHLTRAFDRECIRCGIREAAPRVQSPPEMSVFKNPRTAQS